MTTPQRAGQGWRSALRRSRLSKHQAMRNNATDTITFGSSIPTTGCNDRGIQAASAILPTSKSKNHLFRQNSFMLEPFPLQDRIITCLKRKRKRQEMDGLTRKGTSKRLLFR